MKFTRTHLSPLVYKKEILPMNNFFQLIEESETILFEKGVYKNGPTVVETTLSTFSEPGEAPFTVYIPINIPLEEENGFHFLDEYDIEGLSEITAFDENMMSTLDKMKEELKEQDLKLDGDRLFIIILPVFGRLFVELVLPVKED